MNVTTKLNILDVAEKLAVSIVWAGLALLIVRAGVSMVSELSPAFSARPNDPRAWMGIAAAIGFLLFVVFKMKRLATDLVGMVTVPFRADWERWF